MTTTAAPFRVGQTLMGPLFSEPMRGETISPAGVSSWALGLVGAQSERFRRVTLSAADVASITILGAEMAFNGDGGLLRLGIRAYALGIAYEFDPYFAASGPASRLGHRPALPLPVRVRDGGPAVQRHPAARPGRAGAGNVRPSDSLARRDCLT
jgi:hypothetical protein